MGVDTYRWLKRGHCYTYQPKVGKGDDARRVTTCTALILPRPGTRPANVLVEFDDGHRAVVPAGVLKKAGQK